MLLLLIIKGPTNKYKYQTQDIITQPAQTKQCCDVKERREIRTRIVQCDIESAINHIAVTHSLNLRLRSHITTNTRACEQKRVQKES